MRPLALDLLMERALVVAERTISSNAAAVVERMFAVQS